MLFSKTVECPGSVKSLTEMLKNPRYYARRWQDLDPKASVDINMGARQLRVTSALDISETTVASVSNLVNSGIQARVVEIWDLDTNGLATKGSISVSLAGVPAKASAALKIPVHEVPAEKTAIRIEGEVTCTVPLIGAGLERAVIRRLDQALTREIKVMKEFLGG